MDATSGSPTLSVGYNKVFGAVLLVLGLLCLVLGIMARTSMSTLIGALNSVIAVLYMVRPYFVVSPHAIELRNMLGMTMRRYQFQDLGALEVDPGGGAVFQVDASGARTRLKLTRWIADGGDWRRFLGLVQARAFE